MTKNRKKKRILNLLQDLIRHDFGFYNPIWEWNSLPSEIKDNYFLIEDTLKQWQSDGYIRIFMSDEKRMIEIISIPKQTNR